MQSKYNHFGVRYNSKTGNYHIYFDHMVIELDREEFEKVYADMVIAYMTGIDKKEGPGI